MDYTEHSIPKEKNTQYFQFHMEYPPGQITGQATKQASFHSGMKLEINYKMKIGKKKKNPQAHGG